MHARRRPQRNGPRVLCGVAEVVYGSLYSSKRAELIVRLAPGARLGDADRAVVEPALLYVCFHRFVPQLDVMIERQLKQSGAPVSVPFGDEVIGELVRNGFSEERAVRDFAFIFHLRRAFYFIHGALVGGHGRKRFSGRVIAATNRPLGALRREGRFRDDFFYRLCSDVIEMPTLRRRIAEAPGELTASELLGQYCALLYRRYGTYAEVAKRTGLDPPTSRKYVEGAKSG